MARTGILKALQAWLFDILQRAGNLALDGAVSNRFPVRAVGGAEGTGPCPVDRGKKGSKHTVLVNQDGVPLVIHTAAANESDQTQMLPTLCQFPEVRGQQALPKQPSDGTYAHLGYESEATRGLLRWLVLRPKIARQGEERGSGLGRVRWVVERTISLHKRPRRLGTRYDLLLQIQQDWISLAAAVICLDLVAEPVPV